MFQSFIFLVIQIQPYIYFGFLVNYKQKARMILQSAYKVQKNYLRVKQIEVYKLLDVLLIRCQCSSTMITLLYQSHYVFLQQSCNTFFCGHQYFLHLLFNFPLSKQQVASPNSMGISQPSLFNHLSYYTHEGVSFHICIEIWVLGKIYS